MNKFFQFAALLGLVTSVASANVSINLTSGILSNSSGTPIADASLIQLISSGTDSVFSAPSAASFVTGGDILLASFGLDSANETGVAGSLAHPISVNLTGGVASGQRLAIRWFPTLLASANNPGAGVGYGEFTDIASSDWVLPTDGGSISPSFVTVGFDSGSPLPNTAGRAGLTVAVAIPEPATYALLGGLAVLGLAALRRRVRS